MPLKHPLKATDDWEVVSDEGGDGWMITQEPRRGKLCKVPQGVDPLKYVEHPRSTEYEGLEDLAVERQEELGDLARQDTVYSPPHYTSHPSGVECIEVTEHMTFNLGNAIKYLWRCGLKQSADPEEDLRKARWYINREMLRMAKRKPNE